MTNRPPARVSAILARAAPIAVVFRRGPSRWTRVLRWRTDTDELEAGDWFRGRIYDRRCDVSPNGAHLVYFAAAFGGRVPDFGVGYSWTAVSRLPTLTPEVAWAKDHCWYGGGLFEDDVRLWVNEPPPPQHLRPSDAFACTFNPGAHGEDEPVYASRLSRDGWHVVQEGHVEFVEGRFVTHRPELRRKSGPGAQLEMARSVEGFRAVDRHALLTDGGHRFALDVGWVDFDQAGRLVGAVDGALVELAAGDSGLTVR